MKLSDFHFIDVHYHSNPDLYQRRYDAMTVGQHYKKHQGAVVLKSHLGATSVQASLAQAQGLPVLASVVLNDIAGGLDYKVVVRALMEYQPIIQARLIVHLPTITGRKYHSKLKRQLRHEQFAGFSQKPLTVFDDHHRLKPEVKELIRLSANEPVVLSTGHASKEETYALLEESSRYAGCRLMLNQPANPLTGLKAPELAQIAGQPNVFIEQTALTYLLGHQTEQDFSQVLLTVPRVVYSSDLGQTSQMDIDDFFCSSKQYFERFAIPAQRVLDICKNHPVEMLAY